MLFFISGRSERRGRHAADNGITAIHATELRAPEREAVAGGSGGRGKERSRTRLGRRVGTGVFSVVPSSNMQLFVLERARMGAGRVLSLVRQQPDSSEGSRACGGALPRTVPAPISARDAWLCAREQMDFFALRPREDFLYKPATG